MCLGATATLARRYLRLVGRVRAISLRAVTCTALHPGWHTQHILEIVFISWITFLSPFVPRCVGELCVDLGIIPSCIQNILAGTSTGGGAHQHIKGSMITRFGWCPSYCKQIRFVSIQVIFVCRSFCFFLVFFFFITRPNSSDV